MDFCMKCMTSLQPNQAFCHNCGTHRSALTQPSYALPMGTILNGQFLVGSILGEGGFGITYIGYDLNLNMKVAIKEFYPSNFVSRNHDFSLLWNSSSFNKDVGISSFTKEARKLARIQQASNVVDVRTIFQEYGTVYIVMDYIEGETLKTKIDRDGPMSYEECINLLMPIINSMEIIHNQGIIHRDIKPANIMLHPNGSAILLDLGAAKDVDLNQTNSNNNTSIVVSHGFSPPEQYSNSGSIGPWTDIYSLCAVIYYCITGTKLPTSTSRVENDSLALPQNLPIEAVNLLTQGLQLKHKDRLQNIAELKTCLETSKHSSETQAASKLPKKTYIITGIIIGILSGIAIGVGSSVVLPKMTSSPATQDTMKSTENNEIEKEPTPTVTPKAVQVLEMSGTPETQSFANTLDRNRFFESIQDRHSITSIEFRDNLSGISSDAVDISSAQDGSVMCWHAPSDETALYISGNGCVVFPEDSSGLFQGFDNLTEIYFGNAINTENVISMHSMFLDCTNLTEIDLSSFNTANVISMDYMFYNCYSLSTLDLSGFDTSNVSSLTRTFVDCWNLRELNLSNWDTSNVICMNYMFYRCQSLTDLDISFFDTSNVYITTQMFDGCTNLRNLLLPKFNHPRLSHVYYMFRDCNQLSKAQLMRDLELDQTKFPYNTESDSVKGLFEGCQE